MRGLELRRLPFGFLSHPIEYPCRMLPQQQQQQPIIHHFVARLKHRMYMYCVKDDGRLL